ncbi:MAG: putative quinol monooxygenase [Pseudomonadota bacterium]
MIVVNGVVKSSVAEIDAMREAIAQMEAASRAEEGCIDYTFSAEINDPGIIRITEKWQTLEALQVHFATPHMADFQAAMAEHPPASMDVSFYEVSEIQPF